MKLLATLSIVFVIILQSPILHAVSNGEYNYSVKNGRVTITEFIGISSVVAVPSEIDGYPVTTIGKNAFAGSTDDEMPSDVITSVTIPDSITSIASYAFYKCKNLTSVTIHSGIDEIPTYCFSYCKKLTSITISEGLTTIGAYAFSYCSALKEIAVPRSVTSISSDAFKSTKLSKIYGYAGSYAETYAGENKIAFECLPDSVTEPVVSPCDDPDLDGTKIVYFVEVPDGVTMIKANVTIGGAKVSPECILNGNYYEIEFSISPYKIFDDITVTVIADGYEDTTIKTTAYDYFSDYLAENPSAENNSVISSMTSYGNALENLISDKSDGVELIDVGYSAPSFIRNKVVEENSDGYDIAFVGLRFGEKTKMYIKFTAPDGCRVKIQGVECNNIVLKDNYKAVYTDFIPYENIGDEIKFELLSPDGTLMQTYYTNPYRLISDYWDSNNVLKANAVRSLYKYHMDICRMKSGE